MHVGLAAKLLYCQTHYIKALVTPQNSHYLWYCILHGLRERVSAVSQLIT